MAGPRKRESSAEFIEEILATLDDLDDNVSENSNVVDYSQSLSDMFASNEKFLREELHTLPFSKEDDERLILAVDSNLEEISDEQLAGNRATRAINGDGSSEIEIKEESEIRSEIQVQEENIRGRETIGEAESGDLPERYRAHIDRAGGSDIKLIFEKRLSKTDVDPTSSRLAMQHSKILRDFLTETESVQKGEEMDVNLVDTQLKERTIRMGTWKTMKATYLLKKPWNDVVRENGLKTDDEVQIWSFRVGGELRLALVLLDKAVGDGGESSPIHDLNE